MSAHDTWILVSIPARPSTRGLAVRAGLVLLGWAERSRARSRPSVDLDRVGRPAVAQRPFC